MLASRHRDTWVQDLLETVHSTRSATAFNALSRALQASQSVDIALGLQQASIAFANFKAVGSRAGMLGAQFERVQLLQALTKYDECRTVGQSLRHDLTATRYSWLRAQTLLVIAVCETSQADFEQAALTYHAATATAQAAGYPALLLRVIGLNAFWKTEVGNTASAWQDCLGGLALYWAGEYPLNRAQFFYSELLWIADRLDLPYSGIAWGREDAAVTLVLGQRDFYIGALREVAFAELTLGLRDAAAAHLQQAAGEISKLTSDQQRRIQTLYSELGMAETESKLDLVAVPIARLEGLVPYLSTASTLAKLRFYSVLGRLQLRGKQYRESKRSLTEAIAIADASRRSLADWDRSAWTRTVAEVYRGLVECTLKTGTQPQESLALWAQYRSALLEQDPERDSNPGVSSGQALLSFAELPSGLTVWFTTPHGTRCRRLDSSTTRSVHNTVKQFVDGCANERSPAYVLRAEARQLSDWLLGTWDRELDDFKTLLIETDGHISSIPWAALIRSNGRYWSEDMAVKVRVGRSSPSTANRRPPRSALIIGDPTISGDSDVQPLPDAREEAEKVSQDLDRSTLLMGNEATLAAVQKQIESVELLHFAGHGFGGEGGALVLRSEKGGPAFFRAAQIQRLDLSRCRLAVLSGCATGSGEQNGPADPQSLVWAFLHAHTKEVVASLWNVNSRSTRVFMDHFYQQLLSGVQTQESLRRAAAAVRANLEYRHPYYWASFQTFGF